MKKLKLLSVNREMSIIKVEERTENGKSVKDINLLELTGDDFVKLCQIDVKTLTPEFFAEIDLMLEDANNPNVIDNYMNFLVLRDRLLSAFVLSKLEDFGREIRCGDKTVYDRSDVRFSDIMVMVNKNSGVVENVMGMYTPEYLKPVLIDFAKLDLSQRYGFLQLMPKKFIDEKMLSFFYNGVGELKTSEIEIYNKKDLAKYLEVKNNFDVDIAVEYFSKYEPILYQLALDRLYNDENEKE